VAFRRDDAAVDQVRLGASRFRRGRGGRPGHDRGHRTSCCSRRRAPGW